MFGKKKKNAPNLDAAGVDETVVQAEESSKKKEKPVKKKKNGLSQIFHVSVFETVLEDLKANEPFVTERQGQRVYVAICLNTADIGGMDKKSAKKDEAKGTIIEKINGGRIKVYITDELMEEGLIVLIPEPLTMSEMDDFSLLTSATYELCAINDHGDIELLDVKAGYHDVCSIIMNDGNVSSLLGDVLESEEPAGVSGDSVDGMADSLSESVGETVTDNACGVSGEDTPFEDPVSNDAVDSVEDDGLDDIDDIDNVDDVEGLADAESGVPVEQSFEQSAYEDPIGDEAAQVYEDLSESTSQNEQSYEEENELPLQWTTDAIIRKFYSDELGLEVTTEPFDVQFMVGNAFIPFDENRPEGWLNEQLNEMSRQANLELARMHEEHLFLLRERYFKLVSMQCDRIRQDLDVNDSSTQYGQLYDQIRDERAMNEGDIQAKVEQRKNELEANWKERLQKVGMDAARAAQREYRNKYQEKHDAQLVNLEELVKASFEADYEDKKKEILDRRRMEALTLLDLGITETLNEVSDMYVSFMEDEKIRYQELREEMRIFRDDLVQEDIARVRVLEEDLRQNDKADQVLAEQTTKIRNLTEDFTQKKQALHMEIDRMRADNQARIEELKQDADARVARVQEDKDAVQKQMNDLLDNYKHLEETTERKYKSQISELKDEIASSNERNQHLMTAHARDNKMSILLLAVAVIAALSIGFVAGEFMNSNRQVKMYQQQMYQQSVTQTPEVDTEAEE